MNAPDQYDELIQLRGFLCRTFNVVCKTEEVQLLYEDAKRWNSYTGYILQPNRSVVLKDLPALAMELCDVQEEVEAHERRFPRGVPADQKEVIASLKEMRMLLVNLVGGMNGLIGQKSETAAIGWARKTMTQALPFIKALRRVNQRLVALSPPAPKEQRRPFDV